MGGVLSTYPLQAAAAIRASLADRTNFLLQMGGMAVNNGFFLALWVLFFAGFRSVGGWGAADMALLLGLIMTIVGISGVAFGGYRDMAGTILSGEIDALLTQPKPVLGRLLSRDSLPSAWGDLVVGLVILVGFGRLSWVQAPLALGALACGLVVYLSAATAFASLAFWARGARSFARDLTDFLILFSSYPGSIFSGASKLVVYTLMPAGFIVLAPVRLLRAPGLGAAGVVVGAAVVYALITLAVFQLGLARYRRGLTPTSG
ncbi:MAG: ABC-2 family transporter protein [Caulobacteraceae bacterium]|nr:ABC-2 family transporter protein [Caulobacteraceae bacterium]